MSKTYQVKEMVTNFKLAIQFHLVTRLRMRVIKPHFPNTS